MTKRARRTRDRSRRGVLTGLWLLVICAIAYLPGVFTIPPVDRDESRFAQASRQVMQAAQRSDLEGVLIPKIQDELRLNKPPLIYWAQAASAWFFDRDDDGADPRLQRIGWYRLPSMVKMELMVLMVKMAQMQLPFKDLV